MSNDKNLTTGASSLVPTLSVQRADALAGPLLLTTRRSFERILSVLDGTLRVVPLKVGDIIKLIEADGWYLVAIQGSHRQFKHPTKPGRVTVPGKLSRELYLELEKSILKQAGLSRRKPRWPAT